MNSTRAHGRAIFTPPLAPWPGEWNSLDILHEGSAKRDGFTTPDGLHRVGETTLPVNTCERRSSSLLIFLFSNTDELFKNRNRACHKFIMEMAWLPSKRPLGTFSIFVEVEKRSEKFDEQFFLDTTSCKVSKQPSWAGSWVSAGLQSLFCLSGCVKQTPEISDFF